MSLARNLSRELKEYARQKGVQIVRHTRLKPDVMDCARDLVDGIAREKEAHKLAVLSITHCPQHEIWILGAVSEGW